MLRPLAVAILLCSAGLRSGAAADEPAATGLSSSRIERLARTLEPDLTGRPERLPLYLDAFQRALIDNPRFIPFRASATLADGRVRLTGTAAFDENRRALHALLSRLHFSPIDAQFDALPAAALGERRFGIIRVAHAYLCEQPSSRREIVSDCLFGSTVYLLDEQDDAHWILTGDGYIGYLAADAVARVDAARFNAWQNGRRVLIQRDVDVAGKHLPQGARLQWIDETAAGVTAALAEGERLVLPAESCTTPPDREESISRVLQSARQRLGTPYLWGGKTAAGIDCSGLVQTAFASQGIHLPRDSGQQAAVGEIVATRWYLDGLRPGDRLYFFRPEGRVGHTGLYLGDGQYIEAVQPVVRITSLRPTDENYHAGRAASFVLARRLLD